MQGTKYDIEILAALLSPGSKCAHNLLQLARKIASNSASNGARNSASNSARKVASNSESHRLHNLSRSRTDDDEQASTVHQESDLDKDGEQSCFGGDDEDTRSICDDGCPDIRLKKSSDSSMPVLF